MQPRSISPQKKTSAAKVYFVIIFSYVELNMFTWPRLFKRWINHYPLDNSIGFDSVYDLNFTNVAFCIADSCKLRSVLK